MDLNKIIEQSKKKSEQAKINNARKRDNRPISVSGILQFMAEELQKNNYCDITPTTKDTRNKIHGFIRFLKNNGLEDKEIYAFLAKCIENWAFLSNIKMHTDNRKKYNLDTVPNILDIINCKNQIFNEINIKKEDVENDDDIDLLEEWAKL